MGRGDPSLFFAAVGVVAGAGLAFAADQVAPGMGGVVAWLVGITVATFGMYGWDKLVSARMPGRDRVPERVLILLAFVGGTVGALAGMSVFRHKTSKASFRVRFWIAVAVQAVALGAWFTRAAWWPGGGA